MDAKDPCEHPYGVIWTIHPEMRVRRDVATRILLIANGLSFMLDLLITTTQLEIDKYDKLTTRNNADSIINSNARRVAVG